MASDGSNEGLAGLNCSAEKAPDSPVGLYFTHTQTVNFIIMSKLQL